MTNLRLIKIWYSVLICAQLAKSTQPYSQYGKFPVYIIM